MKLTESRATPMINPQHDTRTYLTCRSNMKIERDLLKGISAHVK